jgi:septal ring factor EnvC (AmiA/AmiB activator)
VPAAEARRPRRSPTRAALALALALIAAPSAADQPAQQLKAVEKALEESRQSQSKYAEEAQALAAQIEDLRSRSIAAAAAAQQSEAEISAIEQELARLGREEAAKAADLQRRSGQSAELLMTLLRLARDPPEALAFTPGDPVAAVRGGLLLGAAIPQLEAKAAELREELTALAALRADITARRGGLATQNDALAKQELALKALASRKAALQEHAARGAEISGQRLAQLSAEAGDLRDLIERLEAEKQKQATERQRAAAELLARAATHPPRPVATPEAGAGELAMAEPPRPPSDPPPKNIRPFTAAHGAMVLPVAGRVTRRYGENDEYGVASKGLVIEARPGGEVVAPFDGRIEFAGPFRGYGQILIIEHGDGYHSLLAGLDRIDGTVGQWLVAGEPVGVMPADGRGAALYLELRRHGLPINPLPWLATPDDKVSG